MLKTLLVKHERDLLGRNWHYDALKKKFMCEAGYKDMLDRVNQNALYGQITAWEREEADATRAGNTSRVAVAVANLLRLKAAMLL